MPNATHAIIQLIGLASNMAYDSIWTCDKHVFKEKYWICNVVWMMRQASVHARQMNGCKHASIRYANENMTLN